MQVKQIEHWQLHIENETKLDWKIKFCIVKNLIILDYKTSSEMMFTSYQMEGA